MNKNSDHINYHELLLTAEVLLKILDAFDSKYAISETEEFSKLNNLYKMSATSFRGLSEELREVNDDSIKYLAQALPSNLREGLDYLDANYKDSLRPKLISAYDYLAEFSANSAGPNNVAESKGLIDQIIDDFAHLPDITEDELPKNLKDIQKHPSEKAVFTFNFNHNTDILSVNGIQVSQLKSTNDRLNEILTNAMNHPGEPVKSDSRMSSFIYDLKGIPKPLKDLFFPVRGKHKFILIPEVTKKMLDDKNLDAETLTNELIELNRTK